MSELDDGFKDFYGSNFARAVLNVRQITGCSQPAAEDSVQEAMLEVRLRWNDIEHHFAYLTRTALRIAYKDAKRSSRRSDGEQTLAVSSIATSGGISPENAARHVEMIKALHGLPRNQRTVIALTIDGFTTQEIAEHLNVSPRQVIQYRHKALKALRAALSTI